MGPVVLVTALFSSVRSNARAKHGGIGETSGRRTTIDRSVHVGTDCRVVSARSMGKSRAIAQGLRKQRHRPRILARSVAGEIHCANPAFENRRSSAKTTGYTLGHK